MARSLKKGPFVDAKLQKKVDKMNEGSKKQVIKTWSRRSMITPDFVGHTLLFTTVTNSFPFLFMKIWLAIS